MSRPAKEPYVCEPTDQSKGRPATFIFLHGYSDDAEGLPLGLAQQFQFNNRMEYLRWVLPNAAYNNEVGTTSWYTPKALPNSLKPRVPGQADEDNVEPDDAEGILGTCAIVDSLVKAEIERGVPADRIVVGGFSQGCAIVLVWGLIGEQRNNVAGVVPVAGYFPLADKIAEYRKERGIAEDDKGSKQWFYVHGGRDILVPTRLFAQGKEVLEKWVEKKDVEDHLYEKMAHDMPPPMLRDLLPYLTRVLPP